PVSWAGLRPERASWLRSRWRRWLLLQSSRPTISTARYPFAHVAHRFFSPYFAVPAGPATDSTPFRCPPLRVGHDPYANGCRASTVSPNHPVQHDSPPSPIGQRSQANGCPVVPSTPTRRTECPNLFESVSPPASRPVPASAHDTTGAAVGFHPASSGSPEERNPFDTVQRINHEKPTCGAACRTGRFALRVCAYGAIAGASAGRGHQGDGHRSPGGTGGRGAGLRSNDADRSRHQREGAVLLRGERQ